MEIETPAAQPADTTASAPLEGETLRAWLRLTNLQFSPRLTTALLTGFQNDPNALFAASDADLNAIPGFLTRHLARLRDPAFAPTDRQVAWVERHSVRLVRLDQPEYPRLLRDISDPPPLLFVRGSLEETDRFAVGIVGSRHATPYGRNTAERLARELAGNGLAIVSGGAVGIDTAAHRGALAGGGRTLALLGCGLDVDYPRENRALFEQIVAHGALISEFPLGAQPEAWRFPARNRLISGMSLGVLVVEAPRQSGALITAARAAEQGRPVLAVPSNIDRPSGEGSNELLKDGAVPVTGVEDVLRALDILPASREAQPSLNLAWESEEAVPAGSLSGEGKRAETPRNGALTRQMPEAQRRLLESLSLSPRHLDAIAQEAGMTAMQAGAEMVFLELSGLVRRLPGNTYIRTL
jgi:DNA processing protein